MAEIVETHELTEPGENGWGVDYLVMRDDGKYVYVEVRCTEAAKAAALTIDNKRSLAIMADRGRDEALMLAEASQSPARRGRVLITIWFDPLDDGNVRHDIAYEQPPSGTD